jgi:hypothetical protein
MHDAAACMRGAGGARGLRGLEANAQCNAKTSCRFVNGFSAPHSTSATRAATRSALPQAPLASITAAQRLRRRLALHPPAVQAS